MAEECTSDKYLVKWSEEDREFVGTHFDYPSLSWLDKTEDKASNGIHKLVELMTLEKALENLEECTHFVDIPNIMTCMSCVNTVHALEEKIHLLERQLEVGDV